MASNPYFDSNGRPTVEIEVSNPLGWRRKITAVIDTGFDGFLSLPIAKAFPIGLLLRGTVAVTLADGSRRVNLCCFGTMHFDGESRDDVMILEWSSDTALVGMEFLRRFNRRLILDPANQTIFLRKVTPHG